MVGMEGIAASTACAHEGCGCLEDDPPPEPCPDGECCSFSSISFYLQYDQVVVSTCEDCTECDGNPFEVTLTPTTCPEEGGTWFINWWDKVFCDNADPRIGPHPFRGICEGTIPPGGDILGCGSGGQTGFVSLDCVNGCYQASFSGPCYTCSDPEEECTFAEKIEYELRAVTGKLGGRCVTAISLYYEHYKTMGATDCSSLEPFSAARATWVFDHGATGDEVCCDTLTWPAMHSSCGWLCCTLGGIFGCSAGLAVATIPNPEWGEVVFAC
jgi:hypothetical protein